MFGRNLRTGNHYRKLAKEAIAKEKESKMVDFRKMKREQEERKASREIKTFEEQADDFYASQDAPTEIDYLTELIEEHDISEWEKNFCKSVKTWLKKSPSNSMSEKQQAVFDKLFARHIATKDTTSPIPTRDNRFPDGVYREENNPPAKNYGFDDMDDDIPF